MSSLSGLCQKDRRSVCSPFASESRPLLRCVRYSFGKYYLDHFVVAWRATVVNKPNVGEAKILCTICSPEPDEMRWMLQHFIQSIELKFQSPEEKKAEYALTPFPEVRAENLRLQNEKKTVPRDGDGLVGASQKAMVRQVVEKAPGRERSS
ncbi:hypothetical protein [Blastopirellula marina]|nr:hypothetical protein [Blastopirellula marina]